MLSDVKKGMKMNRKFLKYCLAAILFLVSVICLVFYLKVTLENRILVSIKSDLQKMLKVNTEGVLQWLNSQENAARLIASRPELKSSIFRAFSKELSYDSQGLISQEIDTYMKGVFNKKKSEFKEYFLLSTNMDYQGKRYGNSVILNGQIISQLSQLKKGDSFVQLPFIHKDNEHENIEMFIATPILNNSNKIVAVLGLLLDPKTSFSRIMKASRFGNSAETFAINTEHKMISESRFIGKVQQNQFSQTGLKSNILNIEIYLPKQVSGFHYPLSDVSTEPYMNYTGNAVIGAWTFIPKYNFTLISEISKNEAYEPLLFFRKVYLIIIGIILLLSISLLVTIVFSFSSRKKLLLKLKKIGNYQIYKQIGEGALGVVYEGKHQYLQRKTALKVLKPEVCTEESITSFKNEVRLSSQLTHPNTISIYDRDQTVNLGLGYRTLINEDRVLLGANIFLDYSFDESHQRNGAGLEAISSVFDLRANYYDATSGIQTLGDGSTEEALDGWDMRLDYHLPIDNDVRIFASLFEFENASGLFELKGEKYGLTGSFNNLSGSHVNAWNLSREEV